MQSRGSARDSSFECKLINYSAFEQREETTISNGCCRECKKKKKDPRSVLWEVGECTSYSEGLIFTPREQKGLDE